jgi:bifunctional non-homologous end joining protein LigD
VIDGEVVALDAAGRPDFNLLQNFRDSSSQIVYYVFDLLVYQDSDLTRLPLKARRGPMLSVLKFRSSRVFASEFFEVSAEIMLQSARELRSHLERMFLHEPTPAGDSSPRSDRPASQATGTSNRTTWLTVAGVGAVAGLITAIAALVSAFRKN